MMTTPFELHEVTQALGFPGVEPDSAIATRTALVLVVTWVVTCLSLSLLFG